MRRMMAIFAAVCAFSGCPEKKIELPKTTPNGSGKSVEVSKTYKIEASTTPLKATEKSKTTLVVKATAGFDVNPEFPWKFTFEDPNVATKMVDKSAIKFGDGTATVPFEIETKEPGKLKVVAMGSFSICKKGDNAVCYFVKDEPFPVEMSVE